MPLARMPVILGGIKLISFGPKHQCTYELQNQVAFYHWRE